MNDRRVYQSATVASVLALVAIVVQLIATNSVPSEVLLQPFALDDVTFVDNIELYPQETLLFFAGDTLFPLSYALVFVGLFVVTSQESKAFALVGLGMGLLTALADVTENAFFITYATMATNEATFEPQITTVYLLTTLKWTFAFGTLYAFALSFPRHSILEKLITILMLIFPIFGVITVALPDLIVWRGLFLLIGMILFAVYFGQLTRQTTSQFQHKLERNKTTWCHLLQQKINNCWWRRSIVMH